MNNILHVLDSYDFFAHIKLYRELVNNCLMFLWALQLFSQLVEAPLPTKRAYHRISATTLCTNVVKMSGNIKYMLFPWIMSPSSWKFWISFQTRLPRNVFFFSKNSIYRVLSIFQSNLLTNLLSYIIYK